MNESLHLYLNGTQALLRRQSGWPWRRGVAPVAAFAWDAQHPASLVFAGLPGLGKTPPGRISLPRTLHVYAGSALCRFMAVDLPPGLRDEAEARAAAQGQMQHQLGLQPGDWEFSLDRAAGAGKSVACAARRVVVERVRALAQEHGLRLVSFRPFIAGVWNALHEKRAAAPDAALLAVEHDAFTTFIERAGKLDAVGSLAHQRPDDLAERELRRLSYSFGGDAQETIRLLLPEALRTQATAHAGKMPRRADYLHAGLYADFRDLLFQPDEGSEA